MRSRDLSFCLACAKIGRSCEIEPFSKSDFIKIDKERVRLDDKKDRANEETKAHHAKINTALAKAV